MFSSIIYFTLSIACLGRNLATTPDLIKVGKLEMQSLGFGTWSWGNSFLWGYDRSQDVELKKTYEFFMKQKSGLWIDTAEVYGASHRSEELIGQFSETCVNNGNNRPYILTKCAPQPLRFGRDSMILAGKASHERLKMSTIDMLQLHWPPSRLLGQENSYLGGMCQLVQEGFVRQLGVSNYGPIGLRRVVETVRGFGDEIYSDQVQCSLLAQNMLQMGLVDACEDLGVQPMAYSPLALGLLTDKYSLDGKLPSGIRSILFKEYLPKIEPLLKVLRDIARARERTVAQVALNWVSSKGFLVLVGARTVEQARENLGAVGWGLSDGEITEIDGIARKTPQFVKNPQECA